MRLIDADILNEHCNRIIADDWNSRACPDSWADAYEAFKDDIDDMPTIDPKDLRPKAKWRTLDDCSNAGVYCTRCYKKVYRVDYANQKVKSRFCPNCGAEMEGEECL